MSIEEGKTKSHIWEIAHRPKTLSELCSYPALKKRIKMYQQQGDIPHLILYGGTGTGKTTIANIIATMRDDFDMVFYECQRLELKDVKNITHEKNQFTSFLLGHRHKIVIMDEFTEIKQPHQKLFGRVLENPSSKVRYIFTTNDVSDIQPMISSRCQMIPSDICEINKNKKLVMYKHHDMTIDDWKEQLKQRGLQVLRKEVEWGRIKSFDEKIIDKVLEEDVCCEDVRTFIRTLGEQTKMSLMDD